MKPIIVLAGPIIPIATQLDRSGPSTVVRHARRCSDARHMSTLDAPTGPEVGCGPRPAARRARYRAGRVLAALGAK